MAPEPAMLLFFFFFWKGSSLLRQRMRSPKREHGMCSRSPRKGERPRTTTQQLPSCCRLSGKPLSETVVSYTSQAGAWLYPYRNLEVSRYASAPKIRAPRRNCHSAPPPAVPVARHGPPPCPRVDLSPKPDLVLTWTHPNKKKTSLPVREPSSACVA
jgi:hypothetical protein